MLLTMRAFTRAARNICYATAVAIDRAHRTGDEAERQADTLLRAHPTSAVAANILGSAQVAQAKAFWEQSVLEYQKAALNAFAEVSNALISREKFNESEVHLVKSVAAYQESVKVSMQRYVAGKASYFEVLLAQQDLFPAENSLALTQLNQRLAVVQLYKALGGGWQLDDVEWVEEPGPASQPDAPAP
jgi:hypothetical protein